MKFKLWISLCIVTFALSACSSQEILQFQGENMNWKVEYQADIRSESSESTSFTIKYIGNGNPPEKIYYQIDSSAGESNGNTLLNDGIVKVSSSSCTGCATTSEGQEMHVIIKWKGETEKLILRDE